MSRVAKTPIIVPINVDIKFKDKLIYIKGKKGELIYNIHKYIYVNYINNIITVIPFKKSKNFWAIAGTIRAIINSMIIGVTNGFSKKLNLIGIGYKATIKDKTINLYLGFSHTINYLLPSNITAECPSQTEIILKGINKQVVGQVAADLRSYRIPEPYKGKGIRYADEIVHTKEAKKK